METGMVVIIIFIVFLIITFMCFLFYVIYVKYKKKEDVHTKKISIILVEKEMIVQSDIVL